MLDCLDASAVRRWCAAGLAALQHHQHEINELNVYPVPDGDTGTNLVFTLRAAHQALTVEPDGADGDTTRLGRALRCMARGALLGARGSSGVIVSQLLRGVADALAPAPAARGRAFAEALRVAAKASYSAVAEPVEGTILTVATAAATSAVAAESDDLPTVVRAAVTAAERALARTPEQLPALARAGVVDAGGRGLVVLLAALAEVVTGQTVPVAPANRIAPDPHSPVAVRETGSAGYAYEVQYLLDADEPAVDRLRRVLAGLGDSLVVVGTEAGTDAARTWNVHVHVNDVGMAIEAGVVAGRPHRISVTRFADQVSDRPSADQARDRPSIDQVFDRPSIDQARKRPGAAPAVADPDARAVVVMATGRGLAELLLSEGAYVVDGNPSTSEVLAAIRATGAGRVVVLPNDPDVQPVAAAAAAEARSNGIRVGVVPTRSPVQALAALAVRDHTRRFEDDLIAMAEAAGACRYAEVTRASREALTVAGRCQPGDVLALVEGEVNLIGQDLRETCVRLVDRLLAAGGELVTLIFGADVPPDLSSTLTEHVGRHWPFVEVQAYEGGQPHYPLLVGVE